VIWLSTVLVSPELRSVEPRVLARDYMESVSGAGYEVVSFSTRKVVTAERRWASTIVIQEDAILAGCGAHVVVMDVANVDQLKLDPTARAARVKIVIARTPFTYLYSERPRIELPVVMVAGYASRPEDFDASVAELDGLLARIVMWGKSGFEAVASC
jgi:hypothetical protein